MRITTVHYTPAEPVRIPPLAFLRSVLALAWGGLRHPLRTTLVDLSTGRSVHIDVRADVAPGQESRPW
jgi:hypothetical protein